MLPYRDRYPHRHPLHLKGFRGRPSGRRFPFVSLYAMLQEAEIDARVQVAITGHPHKTMRGKDGIKVSLKPERKAMLGLDYRLTSSSVSLKSNCSV